MIQVYYVSRHSVPRYSSVMRSRAAMTLYLILRPLLGGWLWWRFRVRVYRHGAAATLRPPYLVLANHVNFWDPFLVAFAFDRPINFLAADGNFRGRLMRRLMTAAGSIPKAKARTDMESLRYLQRRVTEGGIVALFPEGQRTWDGATRPMLPATPKLARLLDAPVIMVHLRGAYLSTPRWATNLRRGRLEMHISRILTRDELRSLPRNEINRRINDALIFDEGPWQDATGVPFVGRDRAEHLERAFYLCPDCGSWGTIRSRECTADCIACGWSAWMGASGKLYRRTGDTASSLLPAVFRPTDWSRAQDNELRRSIRSGGPQDHVPGALPYHLPRVHYLTGYRSRPLTSHGDAAVTLDQEALRLCPGPTVPIAAISGINVQYATQLEFYAGGTLHVLRMGRPEDSAFRIETTVLALQELYNNTQQQ
jgi:1-acyl-sn-glycerol-3-phosphate acyltransferase